MKKKKLLPIFLAVMICVTAIFVYFFNVSPQGDSVESREALLNREISEGSDWTIAKELELDGYIISGAYSTDNKSTLAIFRPTGDGNYKHSISTTRNGEEVIISCAVINETRYDLIWFNGAKTKYAEITYTMDGQIQETLRYDTDDMDIICNENPERGYSIQAVYYDDDGNKYE